MFSTLFTAALFVAPALAGFAISSPKLVQCQKATASWEPKKAPYNLILVSAADPCGDALLEVGDFNKTFVSFTAAVPAGTVVQLSLVDADDNEAWSGNITVGASTDSSCLPGHSAASSSTSASATGSSPAPPSLPTPANGATTPGSTDDGSASDDGTPAVPIGAANAGTNARSSAPSARQVATPLMVVSALAAAFALSL